MRHYNSCSVIEWYCSEKQTDKIIITFFFCITNPVKNETNTLYFCRLKSYAISKWLPGPLRFCEVCKNVEKWYIFLIQSWQQSACFVRDWMVFIESITLVQCPGRWRNPFWVLSALCACQQVSLHFNRTLTDEATRLGHLWSEITFYYDSWYICTCVAFRP